MRRKKSAIGGSVSPGKATKSETCNSGTSIPVARVENNIHFNSNASSSSSSSHRKIAHLYPTPLREFFETYIDSTYERAQTFSSGNDSMIRLQPGDLDTFREEYMKIVTQNVSYSQASQLEKLEVEKESAELEEIRKSYGAVEHKYQTLTALSTELSRRLAELETSSQGDLKLERERRLHMSKSFSATINGISTKLELLNKRRETVLAENNQLRVTLKQCLEEFDFLEEEERQRDGAAAATQEAGRWAKVYLVEVTLD
jgi:DNA repair exonuclease SbcCD ATPase subunit